MFRTRIVSLLVMAFLLCPGARGGVPSGVLRGVTRSSEGAPLSGVQVIVHNLDEDTNKRIISDGQGAFRVEDLKPGRYQLLASKAGLAGSSSITVELAPQQNLRVDMTLTASTRSKGLADAAPGADMLMPQAAVRSDNPPLTPRERQLLERVERLEQRLAELEAKEAKGGSPVVATPTEKVTQDVASNELAALPAPVVSKASAALVGPAEAGTHPGARPVVTARPAPASPDQAASKGEPPARPALEAAMGVTSSLQQAEKPAEPSAAPTTQEEMNPQKPAKIDPFSDCGLDLAERQSPHQEYLLGLEILYAGNPLRHYLYLRLQPSGGPLHGRVERTLPVR